MVEGLPWEDIGRPGFAMLRENPYVYVEYESGEKEFYDMSRDPSTS